MSKITVKLTKPQIEALLNASSAMLAGQEGEGDFLCSAAVLNRAHDALIDALESPPNKRMHRTLRAGTFKPQG